MTPVQSFFIELLNRLKAKSPRFFLVLSIFGASLTGLGWLPTMLHDWFNVDLPHNLVTMCRDIAKYATGFFAATVLPVNGIAQNKLPFTEKK